MPPIRIYWWPTGESLECFVDQSVYLLNSLFAPYDLAINNKRGRTDYIKFCFGLQLHGYYSLVLTRIIDAGIKVFLIYVEGGSLLNQRSVNIIRLGPSSYSREQHI